MFLINFSHSLTLAQRTRIEHISERVFDRIIDAKTQFDHEQPFPEQARQVVDATGLSSEQWQTARLLSNLLSLSVIAALVSVGRAA